ncbi:hypothetical protein CAJAP_07012 [Camponotus japonicus]
MNNFKDENDRDDEKGSVSLYKLCKIKSEDNKFDHGSKVMKFVEQKVEEIVPANGQITIHYIRILKTKMNLFIQLILLESQECCV